MRLERRLGTWLGRGARRFFGARSRCGGGRRGLLGLEHLAVDAAALRVAQERPRRLDRVKPLDSEAVACVWMEAPRQTLERPANLRRGGVARDPERREVIDGRGAPEAQDAASWSWMKRMWKWFL